MNLHELYAMYHQEWGKPLVIHPQGDGIKSFTGVPCGKSTNWYWSILELDGQRRIALLIHPNKAFFESPGLMFYDCPEYFFELVPEVDPIWREQVRDYWRQLTSDDKK